MGFDHVLMKGKQKNEAEFGLIFSAYNLRRILSILGITELKKRLEGAFLCFLTIWLSVKHIIRKYFIIHILQPTALHNCLYLLLHKLSLSETHLAALTISI